MGKWSDKLAELERQSSPHIKEDGPDRTIGQIANLRLTRAIDDNLDVEFCPFGQFAQRGGLVNELCAAGSQDTTSGWLDALLARPRPDDEPLARWKMRCAGVRRFVEGGWHHKAAALGWSHDELFGVGTGKVRGAAWFIEGDRILFVTGDQLMACDRKGFARPIYRGVSY